MYNKLFIYTNTYIIFVHSATMKEQYLYKQIIHMHVYRTQLSPQGRFHFYMYLGIWLYFCILWNGLNGGK